jgi:hypothetical protein
VASNGTVQAKTWNPNGLAAVANLPWPWLDDFFRHNALGMRSASANFYGITIR